MTEKDPNGIEQHSPGAKLDAGKPDASLLLLFGRALAEVAKVGTFGARKYTRGGWQHVQDGETRYTAALVRHLLAEGSESCDTDSGLRHSAHAAWNALARLELELRRIEGANQEQQGPRQLTPASGPSAIISQDEFQRLGAGVALNRSFSPEAGRPGDQFAGGGSLDYGEYYK